MIYATSRKYPDSRKKDDEDSAYGRITAIMMRAEREMIQQRALPDKPNIDME